MATFEQCQREYDNHSPEEPDEGCPECGADIIQAGYGFKCTVCAWFCEPDFYELEEKE